MKYTPKQQRILNGVHHKIELLRRQKHQKANIRPFKKSQAALVLVGATAVLIALLVVNPFFVRQPDEAAPRQLADAGGLVGAEGAGYTTGQEEQAEAPEAMPECADMYSQEAEADIQLYDDVCRPAGAENTGHAFSLTLLSTALKKGQGNVAISPAAVELSLLMLYTEAYGDTQRELTRVLHTCSEADALEKAAAIQRAFSEKDGLLDISLTFKGETAFDAEFIQNAKNNFGAQADGGEDEDGGKQGKQREHDAGTKLTVFNAADMRNDTQDAPVSTEEAGAGGSEMPMHRMTAEMDYGHLDELRYVTLPYTQNSRIMLILPQQGVDMQTAADTIEQSGLNTMLEKMEKQTIRLTMPNFQASSDTDLVPLLKQMGLGRLFDEKRCELNLSQGAEGVVYVEQMLQSCGVGMEGMADETLKPEDAAFSMTLDEPFLYIVYSEDGTVILACGAIIGI